jgi:bacterioferritin-associated ferredoxin
MTEPWPETVPAPWVTHLTCPACHTPDALLAFDGVGTVCAECGDTTRALIGMEDA